MGTGIKIPGNAVRISVRASGSGAVRVTYPRAGRLAGGAALLLAWMWYYGLIGRAEYVGYHCNACGGDFVAKFKRSMPTKCRFCREKKAIYGFICGKCSTSYGVLDRSGPKFCPKCRSGRFLEMTEEELERTERERRTKKEREDEQFRIHKIKVE